MIGSTSTTRAPGWQRVDQRLRSRSGRGPSSRSTPSRQSHTPSSVCRAGQRRVAQPGRQVVVQHRDRLGLGGDDQVARRRLGAIAWATARTLLFSDRAPSSCAHMTTTSASPTSPSRRACARPPAASSRNGGSADREVAVGPGRRDLRRRVQASARRADGDERQRDGGPAALGRARPPARRSSASSPAPAADQQDDLRRSGPSSVPGTRRAAAERRRVRPRRARCGRPGRASSGPTAGRARARRRSPAGRRARSSRRRRRRRASSTSHATPRATREEDRPVVRVEQRRQRDGEAERSTGAPRRPASSA